MLEKITTAVNCSDSDVAERWHVLIHTYMGIPLFVRASGAFVRLKWKVKIRAHKTRRPAFLSFLSLVCAR